MNRTSRFPAVPRRFHCALLPAVFLAGMLPAVPVESGTPHDANVAPAPWGELLRRHLMVTKAPEGGEETRFDYAGLRARSDQAGLRAALRAAFASVDPEVLEAPARLAWAINAYNFLVIDVVTEHFVSAAGDTLDSVADIGDGNFSVFDEPRITVGGKPWSLDSFERHFLFLDVDREAGVIPARLDPRIHFAIVCAARGCPPLLPEPYRGADLDVQLDRATRNTLRSPRHLRLEGESARLSALFLWYEADFGGFEGVVGFVRAHAPSELAARLGGEGTRFRPDIEWDWALNRP